MQQEGVGCGFVSSDSWVILSPIEQSIKRKIEAVGTPLKDWDIQINYGIKTGFNDAFIINTEKRDEILANCQTEDERNRTAELIRPILRGRDVKRYGYDWAGLWLINAHNGLKSKGIKPVDINDYPAIKEWLDNGGVAYNGKMYKGFSQIEKRSDRGDTPYNLRNCAYMEDFSKPKIVWAELARTGNAFALDFGNNMVGNTGYILTVPSNNQDELLYLLAFLNSRSMLYSLNQITTRFDENGWRWLRQFVEQLRVPPLINKNEILSIVATVTKDNKQEVSEILNNVIADIYNFTDEEKAYINQTLSNY